MRSIRLLFHTVRHLKLIQIIYRIRYRLIKSKARSVAGASSCQLLNWVDYSLYPKKMVGPNQFVFLNVEGALDSVAGWNNDQFSKLWLYNLHYFDDLVSDDANNRISWHQSYIQKWIDENPAGQGNGWEPYPTSLRIVNLIKFALAGNLLGPQVLNSLAQQADFLSRNLEYHLLGNHLFANAKALVFAGRFIDHSAAYKWYRKGIQILTAQLDEQVLDDGGNFELSPMYHSIMLVDLLDLINLNKAYPNTITKHVQQSLNEIVQKMLFWLDVMSHPDGEISFFNDSAMKIAASPERIFEYASMLGLKIPEHRTEQFVVLVDSGYSSVKLPNHKVLFDHGNVGPDYQPGHAHADTLSIEWSVGAQRVLVNSGTSLYGISDERLNQRKTASHNTVVVDNQDSSEVWSGFRVARRARAHVKEAIDQSDFVKLTASHDGFLRLPGSVIHERSISMQKDKLQVIDSLEGNVNTATAFFHLHPAIQVDVLGDTELLLSVKEGLKVKVKSSDIIKLLQSNWYPEFGKSIPNQCLSIDFTSNSITTVFYIESENNEVALS